MALHPFLVSLSHAAVVQGHALPADLFSGWSVLGFLIPTVAHGGKMSDQVAFLTS